MDEQRIQAARRALRPYRTEHDRRHAVAELVCDLMNYCEYHRIDFQRCREEAEVCYLRGSSDDASVYEEHPES